MNDQPKATDVFEKESKREPDEHEHHAPGTMVLVLILLVCFAVYYFANWKALADVWHVR
jgi:NADH:ubiquinone oxidoreductase subunit 5 (subunit L)/multisubunit Na+/H+ antiporter MnhA subunit